MTMNKIVQNSKTNGMSWQEIKKEGLWGQSRGFSFISQHNTETIPLKLVSCLAYSSTVKTVEINSSETLVYFMIVRLV
jgi:hypothetical protein